MPKLRIFHSADWHIGKGLGTIDRTDDFRVFIRDFLELVEKRRPDVILLAGDIFDTSMPANSAQRLYYDMIRALSGTSSWPPSSRRATTTHSAFSKPPGHFSKR